MDVQGNVISVHVDRIYPFQSASVRSPSHDPKIRAIASHPKVLHVFSCMHPRPKHIRIAIPADRFEIFARYAVNHDQSKPYCILFVLRVEVDKNSLTVPQTGVS